MIIILQLPAGLPYRLVIVCSKDEDEKSYVISKLHQFNKPFVFEFDQLQYQEYLKRHFQAFSANSEFDSASVVDYEKYAT